MIIHHQPFGITRARLSFEFMAYFDLGTYPIPYRGALIRYRLQYNVHVLQLKLLCRALSLPGLAFTLPVCAVVCSRCKAHRILPLSPLRTARSEDARRPIQARTTHHTHHHAPRITATSTGTAQTRHSKHKQQFKPEQEVTGRVWDRLPPQCVPTRP